MRSFLQILISLLFLQLPFVFSIVLFGCQPKPKRGFYKIINDNFLNFVDTVTYKTGKLILEPERGILERSSTTNEVPILIDAALGENKMLSESLAEEIKDQSIVEFEDIFVDHVPVLLDALDLSLITKTGRYILVPSSGQKNIDTTYAGRISFGKPL